MHFVQKIEFFHIGVFHWNHIRKDRFWYCGKKRMIFRPRNGSYNKGQKMDIFLRGLFYAFCPKIELFHMGVFHRNHIRKDRFWYCGKRRMIFRPKNWSYFKGQKIDLFLRGLVHAFCPKIELFHIGVFHWNHIRKDRFWYCGEKRMIFRPKNWSFHKG